jgi:three-Cys-motif partner protein
MFTTAMRTKWPELHYVDLFAGAGFARIRDSHELVLTSPLIAATLRYPFTSLHLCDANRSYCDALSERLGRLPGPPVHTVTCGDCNALIDRVLQGIPSQSALCVTFADPFGLHLDFETVRRVADLRSDLIVLMADNMDALRNWARYYNDNPSSSLDRFMGEPGWRDALAGRHGPTQARALREHYLTRLRTLGFQHFAIERFRNSRGADIYSLVYASRHKLGLKFWRNAAGVDERGQRSFNFDDD